MPTILNPQLGYTLTGANTPNQSQTIIGQDIDVEFEAIGFGPNGRPDVTENVKFNITIVSGTASASQASQAANGGGSLSMQKMAIISFSAADILAAIVNSNTLTSPVSFQLTPVVICNNGQSGNILVLASQPYT